MRSHHPRSSWRVWTLGVLTLVLVAMPYVAQAQATIDPTETPESQNGGWVFWMAQGAIILGVLVFLFLAASYLRFAPRFFRAAREEEKKRTGIPAPPASSVRLQYTPPPQPVTAPAPEPAAVGAPAAGAAAPAAAVATAPAPAAETAPPAAAAPAAPRPSTPRQEGPPELDQETFDRVLQEQLDKGTDRRVAEGRARSAAVKAAREKAGGA